MLPMRTTTAVWTYRTQSKTEFVTVKYSPAGAELWVGTYSGPDGTFTSSHYANAVAVDPAGDVLVTGVSEGVGTGRDFATLKYSSRSHRKRMVNRRMRW
jgi:hypothetical protein